MLHDVGLEWGFMVVTQSTFSQLSVGNQGPAGSCYALTSHCFIAPTTDITLYITTPTYPTPCATGALATFARVLQLTSKKACAEKMSNASHYSIIHDA
jgi:hypothetical protein